jgi:hypothetical protein
MAFGAARSRWGKKTRKNPGESPGDFKNRLLKIVRR